MRQIIECPDTDSLVAEERLTDPPMLRDTSDLQQAVVAILRKYADRRQGVRRRRWESKYMRYLPLDDHGMFDAEAS